MANGSSGNLTCPVCRGPGAMVAVWSFIAPTDDHDGTGGEQESFPNPTDASPPTEDARVMVSFAVDDGSEMKGSYPKSPIADDDNSPPAEEVAALVSFAGDDDPRCTQGKKTGCAPPAERSDAKGSFPTYPTFGVNAY